MDTTNCIRAGCHAAHRSFHNISSATKGDAGTMLHLPPCHAADVAKPASRWRGFPAHARQAGKLGNRAADEAEPVRTLLHARIFVSFDPEAGASSCPSTKKNESFTPSICDNPKICPAFMLIVPLSYFSISISVVPSCLASCSWVSSKNSRRCRSRRPTCAASGFDGGVFNVAFFSFEIIPFFIQYSSKRVIFQKSRQFADRNQNLK